MDLKEISVLMLKLAGIIIASTSILTIPSNFTSFLSRVGLHTGLQLIYIYILPILLPMAIGIFMWKFPRILSNKIVNGDFNAINTKSWFKSFEMIAVYVLGLYLLFKSVSDLVFNLSNYLIMRFTLDGDFPIAAYNYPLFIATLVELVFSVFLIYWAKKNQSRGEDNQNNRGQDLKGSAAEQGR